MRLFVVVALILRGFSNRVAIGGLAGRDVVAVDCDFLLVVYMRDDLPVGAKPF